MIRRKVAKRIRKKMCKSRGWPKKKLKDSRKDSKRKPEVYLLLSSWGLRKVRHFGRLLVLS